MAKPVLPLWKRVLRAASWTGVIASFPIWAASFLVAPFLPLPGEQRAAIAFACLLVADIVFWAGAFYLGADVIARFRPPKVNTGKSFAGLRVAVIGATGALGEAIVRALQREGGTPLLLGRSEPRLRALAGALQLDEGQVVGVDLVAPETLHAAAAQLRASGPIDHVICAAGTETHKPLAGHSDEEIMRSIDVDLLGPIHVARAFLPVLSERGIIALLGGFGQGSVALPYYAVDVASRAGVAGFCAATNRELELEDRGPRLCYVSPAPIEAGAERPYAKWWSKLRTRAVSADAAANFVIGALLTRRTCAIMGWAPQLLAWLQGTAPWLGHMLVVRAVNEAQRDGSPAAPQAEAPPLAPVETPPESRENG